MPDTEREQFAQRLIADAEFYDRVCETEADLLDAYARGELSAEDRRDVELRLLGTSHQRERAAFAAAWAARERRTLPGRSEMARRLGWLAAVAAIIVLATVLVWQRPGKGPATAEIATIVLPGATVRSGEIPEFAIAPGVANVEIRIPIEPALRQGVLTASLRDNRAVELWRGPVSRDAAGFLVLRVDRKVIAGSSFELAILRDGSDETLAYYYFRIKP